jgi:hypothetical protein
MEGINESKRHLIVMVSVTATLFVAVPGYGSDKSKPTMPCQKKRGIFHLRVFKIASDSNSSAYLL